MTEVKTRYGTITAPDVREDIIGRFLQHYGEWSWDEATFIASVLPEASRVLDVGAFLGTFGLGLLSQKSAAFVCFVEANPAIVPYLARNVQRNAPGQTALVEALVGDSNTRPRQGRAQPTNFGSASFSENASGDLTIDEPAAVTTLSQLRKEHGPFDLIKLDAEGMEFSILQDDAEFLSKNETTLWVECNEDVRSTYVADLLLSWGLEVHYFAYPSHNPDNMRGVSDAIFPLAYEAGLLASPRVRPQLSEHLVKHRCILEPIWSSEDLRSALWRTPRWGLPEWQGRSAEQVAALAGHALQGNNYGTYLTPNWRPGEMFSERFGKLEGEYRLVETMALDRLSALNAAEQRIALTETALRAAEEKLGTCLEEVEASQRRHAGLLEDSAKLEEKCGQLERVALERLDALGAAQGRLAQAETAQQTAEALAAERLAALEAEQKHTRELGAELGKCGQLRVQAADHIRNLQEELRQEQEKRQQAEFAAAAASTSSLDRLSLLGSEREEAASRERRYAGLEKLSEQLSADVSELTTKIQMLSSSLDAEQQRSREIEARLRSAEEQNQHYEIWVKAVQQSTTWRLANPLHRLVQNKPKFHRLMKFGVAAAAALRRRRLRKAPK